MVKRNTDKLKKLTVKNFNWTSYCLSLTNALSVDSDVINKLETNGLFVWWSDYYW